MYLEDFQQFGTQHWRVKDYKSSSNCYHYSRGYYNSDVVALTLILQQEIASGVM